MSSESWDQDVINLLFALYQPESTAVPSVRPPRVALDIIGDDNLGPGLIPSEQYGPPADCGRSFVTPVALLFSLQPCAYAH